MIELAVDQFLATSPDQRLTYLRDLRESLKLTQHRTSGFGQTDIDNFSDRLIITLIERLTTTK